MRRPVTALGLGRTVLLVVALVATLAACGSSGTSSLPVIRPAAETVARPTYVALGDSYTGAPRVGTTISPACRRTDQNYPHLVAAEVGLHLVDVSCGSARIRDLRRSQKAGVAAQLAAVSSKARLVTVGIGGNDVDIIGLVSACTRTDAACRKRIATLRAGLPAVRVRLLGVLRTVRARAPRATVVVVGYPEILHPGRRCGAVLARTMTAAANALRALGRIQRRAARESGSTFLDVRAVTVGHGLCSDAPWISDRTTAWTKRFHPEAAEQRAIASALRRLPAVRALGQSAPSQSPTPTPTPTPSPSPSDTPTSDASEDPSPEPSDGASSAGSESESPSAPPARGTT